MSARKTVLQEWSQQQCETIACRSSLQLRTAGHRTRLDNPLPGSRWRVCLAANSPREAWFLRAARAGSPASCSSQQRLSAGRALPLAWGALEAVVVAAADDAAAGAGKAGAGNGGAACCSRVLWFCLHGDQC
jgi:hypothetical protein